LMMVPTVALTVLFAPPYAGECIRLLDQPCVVLEDDCPCRCDEATLMHERSDRAACSESWVVLDEAPWMSGLRYTWTTVPSLKEAS
jgi:hypothetical protein